MISLKRTEFLILSAIVVFASHAIPIWLVHAVFGTHDDFIESKIGTANWREVIALLFSISLIATAPRQYGLCLGDIRDKWHWLLILCAVPIVLTAIVYPRLETRPFSGGPASIWLISPLAQDLLFAGFFYEKFRQLFPGSVTKRFHFEKSIPITAFYFSLWHSPGLFYAPGMYVCFQLVYTFFGACFVGMIRQWTGSLIWITLVHMAVNYIAVTN